MWKVQRGWRASPARTLKAAVEASLAGEIGKAFEKLGANIAEVKADNIAGAVAQTLAPRAREYRGDGAEP